MNADIKPIRTAAELALADMFATAKGHLPGAEAVRASAFAAFMQQGLPHRRVEAWKYTDLRALMRDAKPLATAPDAQSAARVASALSLIGDVDCRRIVLVDGVLDAAQSDLAALEPGLRISSIAEALRANDPLLAVETPGRTLAGGDVALALNTAFASDGVLIHVASGASLDRPIHLMHLAPDVPQAVFTRSLAVFEKGARAMVIESHQGGAGVDYQVNNAIELRVADDAHVDHVKIIGESANAIHVSSLMATIGAKTRFNDFTFTIGGRVIRNQLFLHFAGEGAVAGVRGASLLKARQHADNTLVADHVAPGCQSRELFKAALDEEARSVFQGKITVRADAQKTDARMKTHALLLSDDAEADAKPELEIFADNVQCGHGATSGALDEDLLFYLKARGIPHKEAEALLIQSFIGDAIEGIEHAGLREVLMDAVSQWLAARE
jgi:Fe-S cluster assembly protein SufD